MCPTLKMLTVTKEKGDYVEEIVKGYWWWNATGTLG